MQLKDYQEKAMKELLAKSKSLLGYTGSKRLVFKAPTGSGKTIMVAEFLKLLVDDKEIKQQFSFIWTAPRQLHSQSKNKLDDYYQGNKTLKCSFFEDLDDIEIDENEILFFNWESINKSDNIYIRENEKDNNLTNVIKNTKEEDRQIILIIDECHHHATSDISKKLITDIEPKLTIEVSATPIVENPDESVTVQLEDVKKEGMIKKAVILNAEFENILKDKKIQSKLSQGTEEFVIDIALKKRTVLLNNFEKEKHGLVPINPLVLIQLPDRKTNLEDVIKEKVIRHLKKNGITTDNEKLAIWLSGEHVNKEDVERIDSDVEVLIFKQAIALGWDCPRAQILVLFRDWKSMVFSIQTIGRIMRMPEPDYGHYNSENLNYGYVYTNLEDIEVQEDIAKDYISIHSSIRNSNYKAIDLLSCHSKRQREKTRLSPLFINIFLKETEKYNLKQKIDIKSKKETQRIISDWAEENIDNLPKTVISGDKTIKSTNYELQKTFEYFVKKNLIPFYPEDRSIGRVRESIYRFFENEFKMKYEEVQNEIIKIALSDKNVQHFVNVIDLSKEEYKNEVIKRQSEIEYQKDWNIPESISYTSDYVEQKGKKSILQPFYTDGKWKPENAFIEYLNKSEKIEWWFKNGDRDATFFAVPYNDSGDKPFYVDFIVKFKNGQIGLFDTKSGMTLKIAGPKIDGLSEYINNENKKGNKLFGGIVTNTDSKDFKGRWVYFDKQSKELKNDDFSNWATLEM